MDALIRDDNRQQNTPVKSSQNHSERKSQLSLYPPLSPSRPSILSKDRHSHQVNTSLSNPPNPSGASTTQDHPRPKAPLQGWSLPAKNKHAAPSRVRMVDFSSSQSTHTQPSRTPAKQTPRFSTQNAFQQFVPIDSDLKSATSKSTDQKIKVVDAFADDNEAQPSPDLSRFTPVQHNRQYNIDNEDLIDLPSSLGSLTLTTTEREQQLQDMVNSMVLPTELVGQDLEAASTLEGLKCRLLPHQAAGYLWLREREAGRYKGGILADDMGLGKTIQMLALLIGNSPSQKDNTIDSVRIENQQSKKGKLKDQAPPSLPQSEKLELKSTTTLIVAPLAVIRQWEREINEKSNPALKVLVHHGPQRTRHAHTFSQYDVVVTTYNTAVSEFNNLQGSPKKKKANKKATANKSVVEDSSDEEGHKGGQVSSSLKEIRTGPAPLYESDWLRVILDEAQSIKNHRTQMAMAATMLARKAIAKWCLSGTPIQNEALEMYSLIRFLGIPPFDDFAHFKEKISEPLKSSNQNRVNWGMRRLCTVLGTIMLRRTKDAKHDGKPILNLPERKVEIISCDFDDAKERDFYNDLENQVKRNLASAEDTGRKINHMVTLLMLLRLRQACSHPALLNRNVRIDAGAASGSSASDKDTVNQNGSSTVRDEDDDGLAELLSGLSVATKRCIRCQIELSRDEASAGHNLCPPCITRVNAEDSIQSAWEGKQSTKIRIMMKILREMIESGNEKAIIFSQFTSFLNLVEPFLKHVGYTFVRYDGSMRPDDREASLARIRDDPGTRIILISFKAGNMGLNLTSCSRVILMDLWWNPMLEAQSIDRAHRLGQTRCVTVHKLVIQRSVEERILALQDKKRALADAALEGSKLSKQNRLDQRELMYLFSGSPVA